MARYEEDGIEAAKILLSLRDRKLQRWPEWVPRSSSLAAASELWRPSEEPMEEEEEVKRVVPAEWPTRRRSQWLRQVRGSAWLDVLARDWYDGSAGSGAGASPTREDGARSSQPSGREKPKVKVKLVVAGRPETAPCYVAPAGSGPSTSGVDRARSAHVKVGTARKETMAAPSPETPLDYAGAAGSGASSSGDDGARSRSSPAKRKAPGPSRSAGASSGDEGSSSPAKSPRADLDDASAANVEEPKKADEKKKAKAEAEEEENYRDEKGHLLFDLNEDITPWQD